jgi:hypothetical protein
LSLEPLILGEYHINSNIQSLSRPSRFAKFITNCNLSFFNILIIPRPKMIYNDRSFLFVCSISWCLWFCSFSISRRLPLNTDSLARLLIAMLLVCCICFCCSFIPASCLSMYGFDIFHILWHTIRSLCS